MATRCSGTFRRTAAFGAILVALLGAVPEAFAQAATAKLQGKVLDAASKRPLPDVVATLTSPALQGEQTFVTDAAGEFVAPMLPPGVYLVHLESEGFKPFNQGDVTLRLGQTIRVTFSMVPDALQSEEIVVDARPPTVDVGSTQSGVTVTPEFIQNLPIVSSSRSFESLAATAPTASGDDYGVSIGGSTSPENNFVVDGVRVTDPSVGVNASNLSVDFVKEVQVVTGGYMPEYGRSTGGVVNVVTKSGGNEYHGSVTLDLQPAFLTAKAKEIVQPGSAISTDNQNIFTGNLSAELGGPIVKDKLWFFVGTQLGYHVDRSTRRINTVTYTKGCPVDAAGMPTTKENAVRFDASVIACDESQKDVATDAEGNPVGAVMTPHAKLADGTSLEETFSNVRRSLQVMGKLSWLIDPNNTLTASAWVSPGSYVGPGTGNLKGDISYYDTTIKTFVGDYSLRWNGAFLNKTLLLEAVAGWHHQATDSDATNPGAGDLPAVLWDRPHSLVEFRPELKGLCGVNDAEAAFKTCPLTNYRTGGPGLLEKVSMDRYQARATGTYLFKAAGAHELKLGGDYEGMLFNNAHRYSGDVALREGRTTWYDYRRFGFLKGPDDPVFLSERKNVTGSGSFAAFAQDSWRPLDFLTVNVGVRWENQTLYGGNGADGLGGAILNFNNNWMPRIGVIVDPTRQGRSKIFASYGWFYESLVLGMMDRQFPTEKTIGAYRNKVDPSKPGSTYCDPKDPESLKKGGSCHSKTDGSLRANPYASPEEPNQTWTPTGGGSTPIDPNLGGQRMSEFMAGAEYEIEPELRIGTVYTHRQLDRIIEDLSNDGGATYFLANPGEGLAADFPKPQRDYDALTFYANRSWSKQWLLQASYTLSWLYGNYAGLFRPETGQLDPNITSDYDLKKLLANRTGYLPGDHRHALKLFTSREFDLAPRHKLVLGAGVNALSGGPTNFLGADDTYGPNESYILPRGSGDRLPTQTTIDAAIKYGFVIKPESVLTVGLDIYNLFDQQVATALDERYTDDTVLPIENGTRASLKSLQPIIDGQASSLPVTVNPNFGKPIAYSAPLSARILVRWTF